MSGDVSIVIVSYNSREHLARCLGAVADGPHEVVVVDNASTDGSSAFVRERFPSVRLLELTENRGFGAGNNAGMKEATGSWLLLLNSDAWPVEDAVERLAAFAESRPRLAAAGPRVVGLDGRPQATVRAFPTLWRLATEYFFLRKLAPRSRALNAFYGAGFDYRSPREADWLMGSVLLLRREAVEEAGCFDERFFMFGEEVDLCYRLRRAGWTIEFTAEAEFEHVGGGSTRRDWGRMFQEQLRSHLRFFAKHHGRAEAERARRLLVVALRLRGVVFRGERGRSYGEAARWLAASGIDALLRGPAGRGGPHA